MTVVELMYYFQVLGEDQNGEFIIEIQKDCSQVSIETGDGDVYFNTSRKELTVIRDCINNILANENKRDATQNL